MANKRIKDLATTATTPAGDDFIALDGPTNNTRKMSADNLALKDQANTFTQNQTLNGTNNVAPNQTAASGSSIMTRDLGDARYGGPLLFVRKTANTGRASTTTRTDDPHLVLTVPQTGTYEGRILLHSSAADTTGGFNAAIVYTGTLDASAGFYRVAQGGTGFAAVVGTLGDTFGAAGTGNTFPSQFGGTSSITGSTNRSHGYDLTFMCDFTTTGDLVVQWAQNVSSATTTNLLAGSYITLRKIA